MQPEKLGFSSSRLQTLDRYFAERFVDRGLIPGAMTLVAREGEIAHMSLYGMADVERGKKLSEDTIFRIYSMTKPVTSVAFMMLVEEGKVALDDPVHRVIPEWRDLRVYKAGFMETFQTTRPERPMQMIDLLRHTSGLTYGFQTRTNVDAAYRKLGIGGIEKSGTLDDMVAKLAGLPLEFSPGALWNYSVSTDILGYIVGKLSGMKFEQFLQQRIFGPLGMVDTDFFVPPEKHARLAATYAPKPGGGMFLYDDPAKSSYLAPPALVSGGGGLVSTIADYYRLCSMLLAGGTFGGVQYLSPKTLELMTQNHIPGGRSLGEASISMFSEQASLGTGFGLGFSVNMSPALSMVPGSVGEYAWGGAASTYFFIDPREKMIVIFMTQLLPSSTYPAMRRDLRTLVYSAMTRMHA